MVRRAAAGNLLDYTDKGGRLFLTDYSYSWLKDGGVFQGRATWLPDVYYVGVVYEALVDQSFPKGVIQIEGRNSAAAVPE